MSEVSCNKCCYFSEMKSLQAHGECRINSPTMNLVNSNVAFWPVVEKTDWCGEFETITEDDFTPS